MTAAPVLVEPSGQAAERRVSRRVGAIAASATLAIDARAKAMRAAGRPVIVFGTGEPDFPTPAHIVAAAEAACRDPRFHHYTPGVGTARAARGDRREDEPRHRADRDRRRRWW